MATDVAPQGVNGYGNHNGYNSAEQYNGSTYSATSQPFTPAAPTSSTPTTTASQPAEIGKDEVGWFFVEQYYTTLSRHPDKLHLYYNKRSQYVSGNETDKVPVCVGQRAINDRIKDHGFQDCKVRITNVDSQASDAHIVIQVIGEISNQSQPHRKFTQTFVLATQTNGYFVLNDIFRYIIEEEEEEVADVVAPPEESQEIPAVVENGTSPHEEANPKTLTNPSDPSTVEKDVEVVERVLEEKVVDTESATEAAPPTTNGTTESHETAEETADAPVASSNEEAEETADSEPLVAETAATEKPKALEATPVASPSKQTPAAPAAPPKPAVPKSWASLAASANRSAALAPASSTATQTQSRPAAAAKQSSISASIPAVSPAPSANAASSAPAAQRDASPAANSADEWTAVSSSHNRQQSRPQTNGQREPENVPNSRGYIKNVGESIVHADLQAALIKFGEVVQFDISRPRNCAFIDYKTPEAYQAAVAANPHVVNGEKLWVEERRIRLPGTPGYNPRGAFNQMRGGGRGAFRGGSGGERGGFAPRGRGGPAGAPRGRGASQAA